METLANRNNNPGNIKDTGTGQFKTYSNPQEGYAALLNDLETKKSGKSQTGLKPDSTLAEFAKAYAPSSDKNDPAQYTANLANHMGVRPDTKISELDTGKWAEAIAQAEGYQAKSSGTRKTFQEEVKDIPASSPVPPQHTGTLGTNPNDSLVGKVLDNSITRGITNFGNALSFGGAKQLGNQTGSSLAIIKEKTSGLLGGKDNSKYIPEPNFGETVKGAGKTVGGVALLAGGNLLNSALTSRTLTSPAILERLPINMAKETFLNLSKREQLNILGDMARTATLTGAEGDIVDIAKAIKSLKPGSSFIGKLIKGVYNTGKGYLLTKALGDTVGGLIHQSTK